MFDNIDLMYKSALVGFVAYPITMYVVKNFGAVIWTDVKAIWTKYTAKAADAVQTEVTKVTQ